MKPRNKEERAICSLHDKLHGLTIHQIQWAVGKDRAKIESEYRERKRKVVHYEYFCVVTAIKGWQVSRYYILNSSFSKAKGYSLNYISEISQRWMRMNSSQSIELHIFEKQKAMCWQWLNNPYSLSSPLSLKSWDDGWNRGGRTYFQMRDEDIYPIRRFTGEFLNNGLSRLIARIDEIELYKNTSNALKRLRWKEIGQELDVKKALIAKGHNLPVILETLMKIGEVKLVGDYLEGANSRTRILIEKYWRPFILARKHRVNLGGLNWLDWLEYVECLDTLGLDIHSPHYLCPDDLGAAHARMLQRVERRKDELARAKEAENCAKYQPQYVSNMGCFFGVVITTKHLDIRPIQSVNEMREEGERLHHCVYSCGYYKRPNSLIMSAKDKSGARQETIEVNLTDFTITQSRGLQNKSSLYHKEILRALKRNMHTIKSIQEKRCISA